MTTGTNGNGSAAVAETAAPFSAAQMDVLKGMFSEVIAAVVQTPAAQQSSTPAAPVKTHVWGLPELLDIIGSAASSGGLTMTIFDGRKEMVQKRDAKGQKMTDDKGNPIMVEREYRTSSGKLGFNVTGKVTIGGEKYQLGINLTNLDRQ